MIKIPLSNPSLLQESSFVDGTWLASTEKFEVINPYNGQKVAEVSNAGVPETNQAIQAADRAFNEWSRLTATSRSVILRKWHDLIIKHLEDLALILTIEQGKPISEARGEIKYGASFIEWFAEEGRRVYGDVIPTHSADKRITVLKQPVGVVAAITPWNFPNAMITRKVAPALAAGCTVVIKPAELTPLSALALAHLSVQAGFPPGVLNVIATADAAAVGMELTSNPVVKKLSFTGSTEVGRILLKQSADTVKKVTLELGGNAPFIVFADADIDAAVEGAIASKFRNAGQTCVCSNRIFAQAPIYDEFVGKLVEAVSSLKVGNGTEEATEIGPLIEHKALNSVVEYVEDSQKKGGKILSGGTTAAGSDLLYEPTVISHAHPSMLVFQKEIFGPLAPVFRFETEEEVIALANHTEYGLASYFYGRDYAQIWRVAEALEYGMVGINTGMISTTVAPFGGIKQSGFGREGSKYGIDDYLNIKYVCWGGLG